MGLLSPARAATKAPQVARGLLANLESTATRSVADGKTRGLLAEANASKFVGREAPKVNQREFSLDYPNRSALGPNGSRITTDIDGRALASGSIAGRHRVGGDDEALSHTDALHTAAAFEVPVRDSRLDALPRGDAGRLDWLFGRYIDEPDGARLPEKLVEDLRGSPVWSMNMNDDALAAMHGAFRDMPEHMLRPSESPGLVDFRTLQNLRSRASEVAHKMGLSGDKRAAAAAQQIRDQLDATAEEVAGRAAMRQVLDRGADAPSAMFRKGLG